jgi:hypothetical protein
MPFHFCAEEAAALLSGLVVLRQGWTWLLVRLRFGRKAKPSLDNPPACDTLPLMKTVTYANWDELNTLFDAAYQAPPGRLPADEKSQVAFFFGLEGRAPCDTIVMVGDERIEGPRSQG